MHQTSSNESSAPTSNVAAILWDFGGVFTTSPFEAFNELEAQVGAPKDFIRMLNAMNPDTNAWAQFESNELSLDEFDVAFAAESSAQGYEIPGKDVIARLSGSLRPRMIEVLKFVKQHYRVACITNNVKAGKGSFMTTDNDKAARVAEVMSLFDCVIESSKEGIRKPNPDIYKLACAKLDVATDECVFLDDLGINLKPAKALGMHTIKVVDEAQAIADLANILGKELP